MVDARGAFRADGRNNLERSFIELYADSTDLDSVCFQLGIERQDGLAMFARLRGPIVERMLHRPMEWSRVAAVAKAVLAETMTAPDVSPKDRISAAKTTLDAIGRGKLADIKDPTDWNEDQEFEQAINSVLRESDDLN